MSAPSFSIKAKHVGATGVDEQPIYFGPPEWVDQAVCASTDPELFFPDSPRDRRKIRDAKQICSTCPVQIQCLEYAITAPEITGIWGGMYGEELDVLRRRARTR